MDDQKPENTSSDFTQSTANLKPIDKDSADKTLVPILLIAGTGVCCLIFAITTFFIFQSSPFKSIANTIPTSLALAKMTLTPKPNLTATSDAYQTAVVGAQSQWSVSITQKFDDNHDDWYTGTDDNQYSKITYEVKDGKYRWDATAHKGFVQWIRISKNRYKNFYVAADVQVSKDPPESDTGILFREDEQNNYYYFAINPKRSVYIVLLHYQEKWSTLIGPIESGLIKPAEPNRLAVIGDGPHFSFFINDHYVGEMTDNHIAEGTIGIGIEMYQADTQSVFAFDNIDLRIPPPPPTSTPTVGPASTITPTAHVFIPAPENAKILVDTFDSNRNDWQAYYSDNTTVVTGGGLHLKSDKEGFTGLALCNGCPIYGQTFYFQADLLSLESTNTQYGIAFCATGSSNEYYAFEINSTRQTYSLYKSTPNKWETKASNAPSNFINKYPISNTLAVQFNQGVMSLYINDNLVGTYVDPKPVTCKRFGVFVDNSSLDVIADNVFAYKINETPVPTSTPKP